MENKYWRRILDIIENTEDRILHCKDCLPCPEKKLEANEKPVDKLRIYSVNIPRRADLLFNQTLCPDDKSVEDSVAAYVLPEDLPWPVLELAAQQTFDFNRNIFLKRKDPVNNLRLTYTLNAMSRVLDEKRVDATGVPVHHIHAWIGSQGIGKVRNFYMRI